MPLLGDRGTEQAQGGGSELRSCEGLDEVEVTECGVRVCEAQ